MNFKQIYLINHGNAEACLLTTLWTFAYQYSSLIGPFFKLAWIHCLCHVCFIIKNNIPGMTNKPFPFKMGAHESVHITTVASLNLNQCEVCQKKSDLGQVGVFLRVLGFPPPIKLTTNQNGYSRWLQSRN